MSYDIPLETTETCYEVKKSLFYARAGHVTNKQDVQILLNSAKADYPDARHHCWAYQLGDPQRATHAAMSDDGEPSGTAGKPILNVIQHKDIGDIMVVVSRYFGGTKLGAGGLVRAYAAATQQTLLAMPVKPHIATTMIELTMPFAHEPTMRHWISQHNGEISQCDYYHNVLMSALLPDQHITALKILCANLKISMK